MDILEKRIFSKEAYVRSDNAGCFQGFASIYAMPFLSSEIKCAHMDFADPQGGKCICDKKVSQVCHQTACKWRERCLHGQRFQGCITEIEHEKVEVLSVVVALNPRKLMTTRKEGSWNP